MLKHLAERQVEMVEFLKALVECESPSDDGDAVGRFIEVVSKMLAPYVKVKTFGRNLQCEFELPGKGKRGQILLLGHSDTVWPVGTLARMPFRQSGGRIHGPGVLDMKAGIAMAVFAMRALRELGQLVRRKVVLQLNCDEETGSLSSRALTEKEARRSAAVLVLEPASGLEGKLKTARKGVGEYKVIVHGKAAHSGLDFSAGASAVLELARQLERIAAFTRLERGITVNPGVLSGGTRSNVVAARAEALCDARTLKLRDAEQLDRRFRRLRPIDRRCRLEIEGGMNRPPMERTRAGAELFGLARHLAAELGLDLEESTSGGGSDGNFTAALAPTLDGLGAVGEGAHADHENILADCLVPRAALLASLVREL